MSVHSFVPQYIKMLENLDRWLTKAEAHAKAKSFDVNTLLQARLAPDQFPLVRQVQSSCDNAKFAVAYLSGQKPPSHPDTEQTVEELHARIRSALEFVKSVSEKDFEGAADRRVSPPWLKGSWFKGDEYLMQVSMPNFYFHLTTAYSILRHNGVDLGKQDFLGNVPVNPA
jgi:hypothetical protein